MPPPGDNWDLEVIKSELMEDGFTYESTHGYLENEFINKASLCLAHGALVPNCKETFPRSLTSDL